MGQSGYTFADRPQYQLKLNDNELIFGITVSDDTCNRVLIECPAEKDVRFFQGTIFSLPRNAYVYTFGYPEIVGNYGLQVFNAKGEIVYNAAEKPFKMRDFTGSYCNLDVPQLKSAIICNVFHHESRHFTWFFEAERRSSGKVDIYSWYCVAKNKQDDYRYKDDVRCVAVADVTNY